MVSEHLDYSIKNAIAAVITDGNKTLVAGIEETVKQKLGEIQRSLKVGVTSR